MAEKKKGKKIAKPEGKKAEAQEKKAQKKGRLKGKEPNIVRLPANRPAKKPKKKGPNHLVISAVIVIIILIAAYLIFFWQPYTFVINSGGVTYYSNEYTPTSFFQEFTQNDTIYISPAGPETGTSNLVANAMNLWIVVLIGNDINAVQLIRSYAPSGALKECYTNFGDVKTSVVISAEECTSILDNPENAKVLIELGSDNSALLEKNRLRVFAKSKEVIGQVNLLVMKKGFPNAEDIILMVNSGIAGIGG